MNYKRNSRVHDDDNCKGRDLATKLDQELELMSRAMNVSKFMSCFPPKIVLW